MTSRASGLTSARSFRTRTLDQTTQEEKQMTAEQNTAGASFHGVTDWHDIDWKSVSHTVRRLQARIVQATKEKRWGKVKALQRLSTPKVDSRCDRTRLLCIGQAKVSAMGPGRRHCWLFRRDFSRMAFNPYSHGKSSAQEMAQSGISGTIHPLSNRSRYTPGRNYFARTGEHDVGRTRTNADAALP